MCSVPVRQNKRELAAIWYRPGGDLREVEKRFDSLNQEFDAGYCGTKNSIKVIIWKHVCTWKVILMLPMRLNNN